MPVPRYQLIVLGDAGVGKTSLTIQFCQQYFVENYDPTLENMFHKSLVTGGSACSLRILDTASHGKEEADNSASLVGQVLQSDGFLLLYNVDCRASFESIPLIYDNVLRMAGATKVPMVVVGTKTDLESTREISTQEGSKLAIALDCAFVEVSAKSVVAVADPFHNVIAQIRVLEKAQEKARKELQKSSSSKCVIL